MLDLHAARRGIALTRARRAWALGEVAAQVALAAYVVFAVFRFDAVPIVTNDSTLYLEQGVGGHFFAHPAAAFKPNGLKTSGYPIVVSVYSFLGGLIGLDPLTAIVLAQRALYVAALWAAIAALGVLAVPFVYVLTTPYAALMPDFVLTEATTISLGILYLLGVFRLLGVSRRPAPLRSAAFWALGALVVLSYALLVMTKSYLAVFGLALLPALLRERFWAIPGLTPKLRASAIPAAAALAFTAVFFLAESAYNASEHGVFLPVVGTGEAFYWGAWYSVFVLRPEHTSRPPLSRVFAEQHGRPKRLFTEVWNACGGVASCADPIMAERSKELLRMADVSLSRERLRSLYRGLLGGERAELEFLVRTFAHKNGSPAVGPTSGVLADLVKARGMEWFLAEYNGGREPIAFRGLTRGPVPLREPERAQSRTVVVAVLALVALVAVGRIPAFSVPTLTAAAYAISVFPLGMYLMDLWRYIVTPWTMVALALLLGIRLGLYPTATPRAFSLS